MFGTIMSQAVTAYTMAFRSPLIDTEDMLDKMAWKRFYGFNHPLITIDVDGSLFISGEPSDFNRDAYSPLVN